MEKATIHTGKRDLDVYRVRTLVIGSGCAGLNAADWLHDLGQQDVALMTEGMNMGASRNTGSDKQTYYKLSLASSEPDSVGALAGTLHVDGVHGDTALVEAACSAQSFFKLVQLGVPFPRNEYGEFVGYKTDHDPGRRATSAGPLTSRLMTERLEASVRAKDIAILDRTMAYELLLLEGRVAGVLALDMKRNAPVAVLCAHVILATGGPAMLYEASVYPTSQSGMSGLALAAGAEAANLHHWQYGLASTAFRWNVSGSYQQALPRYISVDTEGVEREFLTDYFDDPLEAVRRVFLKGYQWPFDMQKIGGSSAIDLIVHHESQTLGRQVYMDFTRNPSCLRAGLCGLDEEALAYLCNCGALQDTPIERLRAINAPAIALYASHGIDIAKEPLAVAVCAQHHNGGIAVDANWQSTLPGLYVAGEAAGTFGAYRPGGSALNATQVGALRAAEHIAYGSGAQAPRLGDCRAWLAEAVERPLAGLSLAGDPRGEAAMLRAEMSRSAGHLRSPSRMAAMAEAVTTRMAQAAALPAVLPADLPRRLKLRDQLTTTAAVLDAMRHAAQAWGSYGAGLVLAEEGQPVMPSLPLRYRPHTPPESSRVLRTYRAADGFSSQGIAARPLPEGEQWFEKAWHAYRERTHS